MQAESRLRRLLADELGDCCDADVDRRVDELESLAGTVPDRDDRDRAALRTLGDGTRYRLARLLAAADDELCVCELEPLVDVSSSAVSHALSDLADAGLVARRKAGTWRYYRTTDRAERVLAALDDSREGSA